jgi:hypothetical protein
MTAQNTGEDLEKLDHCKLLMEMSGDTAALENSVAIFFKTCNCHAPEQLHP